MSDVLNGSDRVDGVFDRSSSDRPSDGSLDSIAAHMTREDVLEAIESYESDIDHSFGPSTFYDLEHEGNL